MGNLSGNLLRELSHQRARRLGYLFTNSYPSLIQVCSSGSESPLKKNHTEPLVCRASLCRGYFHGALGVCTIVCVIAYWLVGKNLEKWMALEFSHQPAVSCNWVSSVPVWNFESECPLGHGTES